MKGWTIRRVAVVLATVLAVPLTLARPAAAGVTATGTVSIDDVSQTEGDSGTTTFTFTVSRTGDFHADSVGWTTTDGTATAADGDYVPDSGTLNFGEGQSTPLTISITVNGDVKFEPDEEFFVDLTPGTEPITKNRGTGTIQNDDPQPTLSVNDVTMSEGNFGTTMATFTITRSETSWPATVGYATSDGTATAGSDYVATSGTATFAPAATTVTVSVPVNGDIQVEPDETFFLDLSSPASPYAIARAQGQATLLNDDVFKPSGYRLAGLDGAVFAYGDGPYLGGANTIPPDFPVVDMDETPDRGGYWQAGLDGGVFAFGRAGYFGSMGGTNLQAPVLGIAARPQGDGYWLVGMDGGVFAFGQARFLGSMIGRNLNAPIVGIVATPTGAGYWLFSADGGVFSFGDAGFFGSAAGSPAGDGVSGMARTADGKGYWLTTVDGTVTAFGNAVKFGQVTNPDALQGDIVDIRATVTGQGYWLAGADGGVFAFGDAPFLGSAAGLDLDAPVIAITGAR
ncbi:MAG TPA: Calx-beta domain-containing protein [Acidimicrobiales bacterium]|nr:Calx-beta domain-containing protein [Acidimicrobiales bacterium]